MSVAQPAQAGLVALADPAQGGEVSVVEVSDLVPVPVPVAQVVQVVQV